MWLLVYDSMTHFKGIFRYIFHFLVYERTDLICAIKRQGNEFQLSKKKAACFFKASFETCSPPSEKAARKRHFSVGTDLQVLTNEDTTRIFKLPEPFRYKKLVCNVVYIR